MTLTIEEAVKTIKEALKTGYVVDLAINGIDYEVRQ